MANEKITDLDAHGAFADTDLIEVVDDPAGTPDNEKAEVGDLLDYAAGRNVREVAFASVAAPSAAGLLTLVTDGPLLARDNGAAQAYYGPIHKLVRFVPGDYGAWSGGTVVESTAGGITNYSLASETLSIRTKTKAIGSLTYTAALLIGRFWDASFAMAGIAFLESGTSKVVSIGLDRDATGALYAIAVRKGTAPTTFTSRTATPTLGPRGNRLWFQVQYNGTTTTYRYSFDGVNFVELLSEAKATFFTTEPTHVGLYLHNSSGAIIDMTVLGWSEA